MNWAFFEILENLNYRSFVRKLLLSNCNNAEVKKLQLLVDKELIKKASAFFSFLISERLVENMKSVLGENQLSPILPFVRR